MWGFLSAISSLGLIVFLAMAIVSKVRKNGKGKKMLMYAAGFFVLGMLCGALSPDTTTKQASTSPKHESKKTSKTETKIEKAKDKGTSNDIGNSAVVALESNDFVKFVEEYKKLGKDKTPVWDSKLSGKKVTWTGTVVDAGNSQLFVYGKNDYKGETWADLGKSKKLYYSFVAKYADSKQFEGLKTGDVVSVTGDLESRGDFDLDFNWKIYNAVLIKN